MDNTLWSDNCSRSSTSLTLAGLALCNLLGKVSLSSWFDVAILISWVSPLLSTPYANSSPSFFLHPRTLSSYPLPISNTLICSNSFVATSASFSILSASLVLQRLSSMFIIPCNIDHTISVHHTPCTCQNSKKEVC